MKKLIIVALVLLGACYATTTECSTPIKEMPRPSVLSAFYPGDRVVVTFPDDSVFPGQIVAVGGMVDVRMPDSTLQKSRNYVVRCFAIIDGENMEALLELPEFAIRLVE